MKGEVFRAISIGLGIVAFPGVVCSGELPAQAFSRLKSEEFRKREEAQTELLEWGRRQPKMAMAELYQQSRVAQDPEVRERCLAILRELVNDEYLRDGEGFIGIRMENAEVAVPDDPEPRVGIRVVQVEPGSAAEHAGLLENDLIVGLDGNLWRDGSAAQPFSERIRGMKPKSKITLKILRNGALMELRVTLGRRPLHAGRLFPGNRAASLEAAELAAKDAYFRRWLEERKNPK